MSAFKAIWIEGEGATQGAAYVELSPDALMEGDVELEVAHSAINYKDGLAVCGAGKVVRRFPMIPGVDLAGRVTRSTHPDFRPGDLVVAGGCGLGEAHFGGFAERARLPGDWLSPLPPSLSLSEAMAIGTAGVTAMFCIMALERYGLTPDRGPIVVTGAAGGVGSIAVNALARRGWRVCALTGRSSEADYLRRLGAAEILDRADFAQPGKPLQAQRFAAGVDTVGSVTLANLLSRIAFDGAVAATGNAGGMDLPASVAPFILRGVALLGVESVRPRIALRREAWARLAQDIDRDALHLMTERIAFADALERAKEIVEARVRGRIVIDMA